MGSLRSLDRNATPSTRVRSPEFDGIESLRALADKPEVLREIAVSVVCGPIFRELADLAVLYGGVGAMPQQTIDHFSATAEGGVVKRRPREIKASGDQVHLVRRGQ